MDNLEHQLAGINLEDAVQAELAKSTPEGTADDKAPNEGNLASAQEELARAQGWKPLAEFDGDKAEWVPPEVFIMKGRLFKTIHGQKQEIKGLRKAVDDMASLLKQAKEQAIKTTRDELRQAKAQALSDQDHNKVVQIDEQMLELKQKETELKEETAVAEAAGNQYAEYYKEWVGGNNWYLANRDMRADADMYGQSYLNSNPSADPDEVFRYVEKKIKKEYADEFMQKSEETGRSKVGAVVNSRTTTTPDPSTKKLSIKSLSSEEREVALNFARLGIMSVEDYIKNK